MTSTISQIFKFDANGAASNLAILPTEGAKELAQMVDKYLVNWHNEEAARLGMDTRVETFIIDSKCPRFTTGDGKGIINDSVRGKDLFLMCDVGNYSIDYNMFGVNNRMSPDDHYADLKRLISANAGKAKRMTVLMPILYGGRQHRRNSRESLDCAQMLRELEVMGVSDIITFDAHDPRVQNAIPELGFDNFQASYQMLKALLKKFPDVTFNKENFMIVSPDEGAMSRNIYYSSVLGIDLGMFYKRRDYATIVNGRNPIVSHEYIGNDVRGKDIFVADDIIATGDSVLHLCTELKAKGCRNIFLAATFALFTEGVEKFNKAYEEGLFTAVLSTNLTYTSPDVTACDWFVGAEMSKFVASILAACTHDISLSTLLDPHDKIHDMLVKSGRK